MSLRLGRAIATFVVSLLLTSVSVSRAQLPDLGGPACCLPLDLSTQCSVRSIGECTASLGVSLPGAICCAVPALAGSCTGAECATGRPGICSAGIYECVDGGLACRPIVSPTAEVCNGLDDDCDGEVDEDCEPQDGALLQGAADQLAAEALPSLPASSAPSADVVDHVILSRLDVFLSAGATVAQVNSALRRVGAGIVTSSPGSSSFTVAVPRQSDREALQRIAEELKVSAGINWAVIGIEPQLDELPGGDADLSMDHLKRMHFPAAWNARGNALDNCTKVRIVVPDMYQPTLPNGFSDQVPNFTAPDAADPTRMSASEQLHGYQVITTLGAKFDGVVPTGANPFAQCLDVRGVQVSRRTPNQVLESIANAMDGVGRAIVNASYGFAADCGCENPADPACSPLVPCCPTTMFAVRPVDRARTAADFRERFQRVQDEVLVTAAAGNEADKKISQIYPGAGLATYNSAYNIMGGVDQVASASNGSLWDPQLSCDPAACAPAKGCDRATGRSFESLVASSGDMQRLFDYLASKGLSSSNPLSSVMVVGSSDGGSSRSQFSNPGEDVLAIGENIPALNLDFVSGTSFATPQVAALASYLWLLSPELRALPVSTTVGAIEKNSLKDFAPVGEIDAYASVLSLDGVGPLTSATAKIRLALLDVAGGVNGGGNGVFDVDDLLAFRNAYISPETGEPLDPEEQDHSRFDLNGNGFTGGTKKRPFDLDRTGSTQFGQAVLSSTVTEQIEGATREFNELGASDADILCYYAYSPLFTTQSDDDRQRRRDALDKLCTKTRYFGTVSAPDTVTFSSDGCEISPFSRFSAWSEARTGENGSEALIYVAYAENGTTTGWVYLAVPVDGIPASGGSTPTLTQARIGVLSPDGSRQESEYTTNPFTVTFAADLLPLETTVQLCDREVRDTYDLVRDDRRDPFGDWKYQAAYYRDGACVNCVAAP